MVSRALVNPPIGAWPAEMRAPLVAAYLDFPTVPALYKAIAAGEAPRPTAFRGTGRTRERVWARVALDDFLNRRHAIAETIGVAENIEDII